MPISPARQLAYSILTRLRSGRGFAVELFQENEATNAAGPDRRLAHEIVMGVLRWQGALDSKIEELSGKRMSYFDPEVATVLRMGVYQILFLTKVPAHAIVNDAVELTKSVRKRSAAGLVNAVLRKCKPLVTALDSSSADALALARSAMPDWIFERWEKNHGSDSALALARASVQVPPTTMRTRAGERELVEARLREQGIETQAGSFSPDALTVCEGNIHESETLLNGEVVIQDEASQLVAALVAPRRGDRVLDLCAAPGMKTAQIAEALGEGSIVSCDASAQRLATMQRLLSGKMPPGVRHECLRVDASQPLPFTQAFERILVDAPCSGTGTLARNPETKWRLKPEDLSRLAELQTRILRNALAHLAPGGRLVYATCSLEPEENEHVVAAVVADRPAFRLLGKAELALEFPAWAELFDSNGCFRTRPDVHGMDGFFAAVITN